MRKQLITLILILGIFFSYHSFSQEIDDQKSENIALIIIDIQDFYFPGGMLPLHEPEKAASNAQKVLNAFREKNKPVIHVKHNAKSGAEIYKLVIPLTGEKVITKDKANAFVGTDLLEYLQDIRVENLVLCGMQTHMCLEAATRAASDYGFNCIVIEDACTTRDLKFEDVTVPAKEVHYSTLSTLNGTYAKIIKTESFLEQF